jgi:Tfp pilus assembly protein PilO
MQIKNKKWKQIILVSVSAFMLILFFEIVPRTMNIGTLVFKLVDQKIKISSSDKNEDLIKQYTIENKSLRGQIGNIVSDYEKDKNISQILDFLDTASQLNNVRIIEIKPGQLIKNKNIFIAPLEVSFIAHYENFYNYLLNLEKSSKVIVIKQLSIVPKDILSDTLSIKAKIDVYLNI